MNRAHLTPWLAPVLVMLVHLSALLIGPGIGIFPAAAHGWIAFLGNPIVKDQICDWSRMAGDLETWGDPFARALTIACAGFVAFGVVVILRQRKSGDITALQRVFLRYTIAWAGLVFVGMLFQAYYHRLLEINRHYSYINGWWSSLVTPLRPLNNDCLIYPALLVIFALFGMRRPRRFLGAEEVAALARLRAEPGRESPLEMPVTPGIRHRFHPALGVLVLSVVVISCYVESGFYPVAALFRPLLRGQFRSLVEDSVPWLFMILEGLAYVVGLGGWGGIMLPALLLAARGLTGRPDDPPFERPFWLGVRIWACLFLIGMYLFPGMPGYPDIYPTPIILILPLGMLFFAWLGERRMWKHAITPERAATIPLAQVSSGSIPAETPAP